MSKTKKLTTIASTTFQAEKASQGPFFQKEATRQSEEDLTQYRDSSHHLAIIWERSLKSLYNLSQKEKSRQRNKWLSLILINLANLIIVESQIGPLLKFKI